MTRTVYLNGRFVAESDATVPIMDRGLLFADAVYEGMGILDGQITDYLAHADRLSRSLDELSIPELLGRDELWAALMKLVEMNAVDEGFLYLHITRGVAERDFVHDGSLLPQVFAFTQPHTHPGADSQPVPLAMVSAPDWRWARRDIKTPNLLAQVLAKQTAHEHGADEALLIGADGFVTEGGARSFFIVANGSILATPVSNDILHGVTRRAVLRIAEQQGVGVIRRRFTLDEVLEADEAFLTGASSYVEPVVEVDRHSIGSGDAGPTTLELRRLYIEHARSSFYRPRA